MQKTPIEYLDMTWNPIAMRCTPVSAGCKNCWHLRMAKRFSGMDSFFKDVQAAYSGGTPVLLQKELAAPLRRKKPAVIGVQFMGDLFHESILNRQIAAVYGVMAASPHHTFCVLTKRVERAGEWFKHIWGHRGQNWPLPNVILMTSAENQPTLDERVPRLLQIPAATRGVSLEPLLGEVHPELIEIDKETLLDSLVDGLDWVICGAETGPGARPMELDWARSVRDQCKTESVPFFFKQSSVGNRQLDGRRHEEVPW